MNPSQPTDRSPDPRTESGSPPLQADSVSSEPPTNSGVFLMTVHGMNKSCDDSVIRTTWIFFLATLSSQGQSSMANIPEAKQIAISSIVL